MGSYGTNGNLDADKLVSNLSKISGYGGVTETAETRFPMTVSVDGKTFTISDTGIVEKSGPRPTVASVTVTLVNGDTIPEEKVEEGTALKIDLTASLEGGIISSISPSIPYTTNGTEKSKTFTIIGLADGENYSTEYTVQLSEYYAGPNPEAGKTAKTKNRTLSGSTDTNVMTYKNPVIPQGFTAIDTPAAKWQYEDETVLDEVEGWNDGLVIQSNGGSEFVWVPCTLDTSNEVVTYSKNIDYPSNSTTVSISDAEDSKTISDVEYKAIPVAETTQISKYGGFYVARFEAGNNAASNDAEYTPHRNNNYSAVPASKYGNKVWNYIDYEHSYVAAQKMINSSATYGNNKSGLITGTQWDTIMKWLESANIGVLKDNQNWGTYRDLTYNYTGTKNNSFFIYDATKSYPSAVKAWSNGAFSHPDLENVYYYHYHASGLNEQYKLINSDTLISGYPKNIADLGGNFSEWTSEVNSDKRVIRGGSAGIQASKFSASYRQVSSTPATCRFRIGFSCYALYSRL